MKIVIFQPMLKQYRMPLFDRMGQLLAEQGHTVRVVCGTPPAHEISKGDNITTSSGICIVENSNWMLKGKLHFLHHALAHILWADFVITEQANKHIHNYILILFRFLGFKRFAYWGHGQNRQGNSRSLAEKMKKILSTQCDWWFAYTQGVANYMAELGYSVSKITVLNNSIDTSEFKRQLALQSLDKIAQFKWQLGIGENARISLYCGGLYSDKKLDFLLKSAVEINQKNPDFVLLIVGNGSDKAMVEHFVKAHPFIKYLGPLFGEQKALAFRSAELFLCPGLVGLAILDAFTAGLPLVTSNIQNHSPEIEYLQHGHNGLITEHIADEYAQAVASILGNSDELIRLKINALESGSQFSIENMASNFVGGIQAYFKSKALGSI
ncbi:glycosyltransferase family 4 protein [Methylomonas sp. MO1]|uniref:glycosyltransferase family 4 protein n=1 Tax=Methylomonas sp. MO1 TaxID=3073619 RepID=UPI0028A527D6|nr:glycosyltransferase family 4 protein [Methylomonas sp. MO1]MDT4289244.1 glycosyltransferase family 4 protein [Methylomonas sp. MO1]